MHFDKAIRAHLVLQDSMTCNDTFSDLTKQISQLPSDVRGAQALTLSAHLIEMAAYELAGQLDSAEIGELIRCAAELSERSADLTKDRCLGERVRAKVLQ